MSDEHTRFWQKPCREWTRAEREDVAEVIRTTARDDTGVSYGVSLALRSMAASAYEEGEDRVSVWEHRVDFGGTDANHAGGSSFLYAAREQDRIADEITAAVWHGAS